MKKYLYIMLSVVLSGLFGSCSKENPFDLDTPSQTGRLLTTALDVSLQSEYGPRSITDRHVRAKAPSVNDFTVAFYREGSQEAEVSYKYSEMPEIVTLPVGSYKAVAFYGENAEAAWEQPYYEGSTDFTIEADKITDEVNPIVCKFANVRVSVAFSEILKESMSSDCKVTVKVGDSGSLDFTVNDEAKSGYFRFVENSHTLAAEFSGTVDGVKTTEIKTYTDVVAGSHYAITFTLHDAGEEDPGTIVPHPDNDGFVSVDATVEVDNMNSNVDSGEETVKDDMRPQEGDEPGKEEPTPDTPDQPGGDVPTVQVNQPFDMNKVNTIDYDSSIVLNIHSSAEGGIQKFIVEIVSNILTPEELDGILPTILDVAETPEDYRSKLEDLNFPTNVKGESDVEFNLTEFIPAMLAISTGKDAYYNFVFKITDANGYTEKTLKLKN